MLQNRFLIVAVTEYLHCSFTAEEIEHMNQEIHALEHKVEELSQCHVDVHVHTEGDLTQSDGRAVDINLHVQEDHHDDELHEKHHEEHESETQLELIIVIRSDGYENAWHMTAFPSRGLVGSPVSYSLLNGCRVRHLPRGGAQQYHQNNILE